MKVSMNVFQNCKLQNQSYYFTRKEIQFKQFHNILEKLPEIFIDEATLTRIINNTLLNCYNSLEGLYEEVFLRNAQILQSSHFYNISTKTYVVQFLVRLKNAESIPQVL